MQDAVNKLADQLRMRLASADPREAADRETLWAAPVHPSEIETLRTWTRELRDKKAALHEAVRRGAMANVALTDRETGRRELMPCRKGVAGEGAE